MATAREEMERYGLHSMQEYRKALRRRDLGVRLARAEAGDGLNAVLEALLDDAFGPDVIAKVDGVRG